MIAAFFLGYFLGGIVGCLIMACIVIASRSDKEWLVEKIYITGRNAYENFKQETRNRTF